MGPGGSAWPILHVRFSKSDSRSVGTRLTSKSLQNNFHAKENRIRPCCFWVIGKFSEGFYKGLVLRVDSRKTRKTREKRDIRGFRVFGYVWGVDVFPVLACV